MMSSFLESSSSPNIISSLLKFSNPSNNQKKKPKPLTSLTIEQIRLKYLNPKCKNKPSDLSLPKIEQKNISRNLNKHEKTKLNNLLVDFSRHTIGSCGDFKNSWVKKNLPVIDSKTHSTCSNTSSNAENILEKNLTISIDNFSLPRNSLNSKDKFLYKMNEYKESSNSNSDLLETNYRLQRLENNDTHDRSDGKKSRFRTRKKKAKVGKNFKNSSTNENYDKKKSKSEEKTEADKMTRIDSPHILKKSLPDSYKFMTHSSACLGITSKELVEQFEYYQSNNYSNEN